MTTTQDVPPSGPETAVYAHGGAYLRDAVRQTMVAQQLDEQIAASFPVGQRLRVLDVSPGQGFQALRLARLGHEVTGLVEDQGQGGVPGRLRALLEGEPEGIRARVTLRAGDASQTGAQFAPGSFDVVLCHDVVMYVSEPGPLLAGLARVLAPGGLLSLLVRNADALALRPGLAGDWAGALEAFDQPVSLTPDGTTVRADHRGPLAATLTSIGTPLREWYGVRVLTDHAPDKAALPSEPHWRQLLAAEERAGKSDPYRGVAALLHLCGVRG